MDVIKNICDQVAVLDHGKLIETGPVEDIFANPKEATTKKFIQSSLQLDIPLSFQERLKEQGNPLVEIYLTSNEESLQLYNNWNNGIRSIQGSLPLR